MGGKVITIAQQKGGSGKTTLAAILAVAMAARGASVTLIDTDPQGSLGRWYQARQARLKSAGFAFTASSPWGLGYEIDKARRATDIVVIDTPPRADSDLRPALRAADLVLVPMTISALDLWATEGVLELCAKERRSAALVFNRISARARLTAEIEARAAELHGSLLQARLAHRAAYAEAMGHGLAGQELGPGPARAETAALITELTERLERQV